MMKIVLGIEVSFSGNHADLSTESCLVLVDISGAQFAPVDDRWRWKRGEGSTSFRFKGIVQIVCLECMMPCHVLGINISCRLSLPAWFFKDFG